jgi:hypothetical protein
VGLADEGEIDMHDRAATRFQPATASEEQLRHRATPARVRRREVNADVTVCDRAEQCIGKRVHADIGVAMTDQRLVMRDAHAAQDHRIAWTERMHVVAGGDALRAERLLRAQPKQLVRARDVFRRRELAVRFGAFDERDVETEPLRDAGVVRECRARVFRCGAMRCEDRIEAEALRRLRAPSSSRQRPVTRPSFAVAECPSPARRGGRHAHRGSR